MDYSTISSKPKPILALGTEWFPKKGGLSSFNRQLCIELAKAKQQIYCYLPEFSPDEEADARENDVVLLRPGTKVIRNENEVLFQKPRSTTSLTFDLIIGHDILTGPSMIRLKEDFYPSSQTILFIHTSPGEIEWYKPEQQVKSIAEKAEEKERRQKELAKKSTIVATVGPHLFFEAQSLFAGLDRNINIIQFNPGLSKPFDKIDFNITTLTPEALLIGRLEDFHLKGVDIAVKAMHVVYNNWVKVVNGIVLKPKLIIRGSAVGSDEELNKKLKIMETSKLRIQPKNYNPDIEVINEDIRKTAIVLVPSRAEGFGLVGLEAISNGRPLLLSEACGLAKLLRQIAPEESENWIIPEAINDNIEQWASTIFNILDNTKVAAEKLRTIARIYANRITWERSIEKLLNEIRQSTSTVTTQFNTNSEVRNSTPIPIEPGIFKHSDDQFEISTGKNDFFSHRIASAFPGSRDLTWMHNSKEIIDRLQILFAKPLTFTIFPGWDPEISAVVSPIWWFRGGASLPIKKFERLSETKCLIGWDELEIEKIAIYRHPSSYREFVYVKARAEEPVQTRDDIKRSIRAQLSFKPYAEQEYAIYKDQIITREEYDDGSAIIDGRPERFIERPKFRTRFLTAYNFIISSQASVYNSPNADRIFKRYLDDFLETDSDKTFPDLLDELENLDKETIYRLDFNL